LAVLALVAFIGYQVRSKRCRGINLDRPYSLEITIPGKGDGQPRGLPDLLQHGDGRERCSGNSVSHDIQGLLPQMLPNKAISPSPEH
jgi:hypothetical protein